MACSTLLIDFVVAIIGIIGTNGMRIRVETEVSEKDIRSKQIIEEMSSATQTISKDSAEGQVGIQEHMDTDGSIEQSTHLETTACDHTNDVCFSFKNEATVPVNVIAFKQRIIPGFVVPSDAQAPIASQAYRPVIRNNLMPGQTFEFNGYKGYPGQWSLKIVIDDGPGEFSWQQDELNRYVLQSALVQETGQTILKYLMVPQTVGGAVGTVAAGAATATVGASFAPIAFVGGYAAGKWGTFKGGGMVCTVALNAYEDRYHTGATPGIMHRNQALRDVRGVPRAQVSVPLRSALRGYGQTQSYLERKIRQYWPVTNGQVFSMRDMKKEDAVRFWRHMDGIYRWSGWKPWAHSYVMPSVTGWKRFRITGGIVPGSTNQFLAEWKGLGIEKVSGGANEEEDPSEQVLAEFQQQLQGADAEVAPDGDAGLADVAGINQIDVDLQQENGGMVRIN